MNYKIYSSICELIGNTPLLKLNNIEKLHGVNANLYGKLEGYNPAGSCKDRVGLNMLLQAEKSGILNKDTTIIEPTSGNTGIGLSAVATAKGYKVIIVMPNSMSIERVKLLKAYGADLVLTDGSLGMKGAIEKAEEIHKNTPNSFIAGQFENPANPEIHYQTTAPEIYNALDGKVDIFIAGIGTGGTITGIGKYLKEKNPNVQIIGVEPSSSPYLTKGIAGKHGIQGIGAGFIPKILDTTVYSEVIAVTEEDAYKTGRELGKTEGLLVGISSSAVLYAGLQIANRKENQGKNIVMLFPDFGDRYLSTKLFEE